MNPALAITWLCLAGIVAGQPAGASTAESPTPLPGVPKSTNPPVLQPIPPLPPGKPPVQFFRELLSLDSEQRQKLLAGRSPESQKIILAKIQEYEVLPPEQRELRLRVTELRYYLLPLMSTEPAKRAALLDRVPSELRPLIDQRLSQWDILPPEKQKELLENENWLRQVAEFSSGTLAQQQSALTNMPAPQREALEAAIKRWQTVGEDRREEIAQRFEEYFGLRPAEKTRILLGVSQKERQLMERTLRSFDKLDPVKRAQCVRALDKLAQLTPAQRDDFLRNAERWQTLSSSERKAWRDLVFHLSLPPAPRVPLPPRPPPLRPASGSAVATNY